MLFEHCSLPRKGHISSLHDSCEISCSTSRHLVGLWQWWKPVAGRRGGRPSKQATPWKIPQAKVSPEATLGQVRVLYHFPTSLKFLLTCRADPSSNCYKWKNLSIQLNSSSPESLPPQQLSPHDLLPFFVYLLPWLKSVQGHLPLCKGYSIYIQPWNYLNKMYVWVQCWNYTVRDFFGAGVCPGLLSTVLSPRLPTVICLELFKHLLIIALLSTSALLSSLDLGNY